MLRSRTFANVPRIITSWLPRREPYRVEVAGLDALFDQVPPGGGVGSDRAGRGDVVGGDAVAQERDRARARDLLDGFSGSTAIPSKYGGRLTYVAAAHA